MTRRFLLAGLLLAVGVLLAPAHASTRSVHLTASGPSPTTLTLHPGDRVVFVNSDTVPHQVKSQGSWQYDSGPVPPGQTSAATPALTAPGSYSYSDVRGIVLLPQTFTGNLVVPAPAPRPTPPPSSPPPSPTSTPSARPASPAPSGAPSASATPATPSPSPSVTAVPTPTASPSAAPSPAPDVRYGGPQALVQSSPHRYGLPALLALVALGGVATLLGRYLLSLPEGRRPGR